jgi:GTP-binding protein
MSKRWRLVDLPGYGFAHVAREDRARFNQAVNHYLQHRKNLCLVFALIDSSLPPQEIDLEFLQWLTSNSVPYVLVFTKTDTATPARCRRTSRRSRIASRDGSKAAGNLKLFRDDWAWAKGTAGSNREVTGCRAG